MDFCSVGTTKARGGIFVKPKFRIGPSDDILVKGGAFYAIWDPSRNIWSRNPLDVYRLIDNEIYEYLKRVEFPPDVSVTVQDFSTVNATTLAEYKLFLREMGSSPQELDTRVTFANSVNDKHDYISKHVPYELSDGPCPAYETIISALYDLDERAKLEWAIGAIFTGDARKIQKFIVLYGEAGSGKSTVLNIIQELFDGYYTMFDAKGLVGQNNTFSTDAFRDNPLVAIQHDGDLSRIEDNSKLNSIVSHEEMQLNEKYKSSYTARINCFLFMGTNKPVKITDAKSGVIRRLIDVHPSGRRIPTSEYYRLTEQVKFELGQIANHCINVYKKLGRDYYRYYQPVVMSQETDSFYNFVAENYLELKNLDGITGQRAWALYKEYIEAYGFQYRLNRMGFYAELKAYFKKYYERTRVDGIQVRHYFEGFLSDKIFGMSDDEPTEEEHPKASGWCNLVSTNSIFDHEASNYPAQYATSNDTPQKPWDQVTTVLSDLDTSKVHYVLLPDPHHIVIDFDLKDSNGNKSQELNLEAANKWPNTYAEFSKGGNGIHLHYIYDGDPSKLSRIYEENVEVKVFTGKSSLRRKLSKCNEESIAHISSGLPLKGEKAVVNFEGAKNEKAIRALILRNLGKEYHAYTTPSVQFIYKILEDAYNSGVQYDVTDMRPAVMSFAAKSTNQSLTCLKYVKKMHFKSEEPEEVTPPVEADQKPDELVFYDVEVFPNLFLVNYKVAGPEKKCVRMINPSPEDIERLIQFKLVGFNCRRYDNHILYARYLGYTNEELYRLSQRIVSADKRDTESRNCFFREAYNISYTDVYDFASAGNKMSLKKWEVKLGIHHQELGLPWDQPVPEDQWVKVAEYCDNDVISTEALFNHLHGDWTARQMLAKLAGMTVNDTTNTLTTKIIFGDNRNPQLVYTDLATGKQDVPGYETNVVSAFPGYSWENGKNMFRGEDVGRGGYVWAVPGIYYNSATFDVRSMHPSSIIAMNYFGEYTKRFEELVNARAAIKHRDYETASSMLNGQLAPYLTNPDDAKAVSDALKTAINSCYGLTSATFQNAMKHPKNVNNIVALRGALFMVTLRDELLSMGAKPFHIKTDSIKVENPTPEIVNFVMELGMKYGYEFEVEHKFDKICLVNDAVYIAKLSTDDPEDPGKWTATGAQFAVPYTFKTLFSHEPIIFDDLCETKEVKTAMYLDMNEDLPKDDHNYQFIGKVGLFCPIKPGCGGGLLMALRDGKYNAVTNTKSYRWLESEFVKETHKEQDIDMQYFRGLIDDAIAQIRNFGDAEAFIADDSPEPYWDVLPWCSKEDCQSCADREECQALASSYT